MSGRFSFSGNWVAYLGLYGVIIIVVSMVYTGYLARKLAEGERDKVVLYGKALESIVKDAGNLDRDITFEQQVLQILNTIPVILVDEEGEISEYFNFPEGAIIQEELEEIKQGDIVPIRGPGGYAEWIYYKHTSTLKLLTYFPFLQILLLSAFVLIGFLGFNATKKAEQNRVWVGMAKETAHQLGTPISAILGWIEHLKSSESGNQESMEIIDELTKDVSQLELIADRFSKIGSAPKLQRMDIGEELQSVVGYLKKRIPRKVEIVLPALGTPVYAQVNAHLFDWVIENLVRNAIDAMKGEGMIRFEIHLQGQQIQIDVSDTGSGIPSSKFKTVFQPGYTTKKRGWGLGLSLCKRIIENYHRGRIFVKRSQLNVGTTFTIQLPKD